MIDSLYLMPTEKCNCSCTYCYIPLKERKKEGDDNFFNTVLEDFIKYRQNLNYDNSPQLRFTGGEPYLKFNLIRLLIDKFSEYFPDGRIVINSNGTLIDSNKLIKFSNNTKNILYHVISIDSVEKIHNRRRKFLNGRGSFQRVVSGIKSLSDLYFKYEINMVFDISSAQYIDAFFKFLTGNLNKNTLSVSLLVTEKNKLSKEQKFDLLSHLYKKAQEYKIQLSGHHRLLLGTEIPALRCRAGKKTILISSDKKIYSCQRFVGRDQNPGYYRGFEDFLEIQSNYLPGIKCYQEDSIWIADKLIKLYKIFYPQYLEVTELDKIIFGVI